MELSSRPYGKLWRLKLDRLKVRASRLSSIAYVRRLNYAPKANLPHGHVCQEDITNTVMDILNDNEVFDAFVEYNEVSVEHYRIGEEICVHWQTGGYLKCGTAHEHAAEDVQDFRAYLADMEEE